jgi:hypothetical protein
MSKTRSYRDEYPFIVAWGVRMGSREYYIREQCEKASADKAPGNAIYQDTGGVWHTTDEITNTTTRVALGLEPLPPVAPAILSAYGAEIVSQQQATGLDNYLYEIRFPNLVQAAYWVAANQISDRVNLTSETLLRFEQVVHVELQPE